MNDQTTSNFETATCSRCLGSGRYSYNQMDGDRCYGCQGRGRTVTKAGTAAREAFLAANTITIRADEVAVGDQIVVAGGKRTAVRAVETGGDYGARLDNATGEWVRWTIRIVTGPDHRQVGRPMTADESVAVWRPIIEAPAALPILTDRRAEMREYVKAAAAAAAGR